MPRMATERFLIPDPGADADAERDGIRWLLRWAEGAGLPRAAIVVPGVQEIEALERALGARTASILKRDRAVEAKAGLSLEILLAGKLPSRYDGPVFVPWAHDPLIDKVEALLPPALCAQPWVPDDLSVWCRSWSLTDPRSGETITTALEISPVVAAALTDLTHTVNLGTGIGHPSDKASAVNTLRALRHGHEPLDGDAVRAWAVAHGWPPRHAQRLGELAQKVAGGVAVRGGRSRTATDMNQQLARWRTPEVALTDA